METVELFDAYEFICEECGRNSFVSAPPCDLSNEERLELAKDLDHIDEDIDELPSNFDVMALPETVTCQYCKTEFYCVHYKENIDDI